MPKAPDSKKILLLMLKTLMENSDEKHRYNANALIQAVEDEGMTIERKAVYNNIKVLQEMDFDIIYSREAPAGWYMASRDFELPELKLLVDAVQISKFITAKKSDELVKKLGKLASTDEAKQLNRQVYATEQVKSDNEFIFYNVDTIQGALAEGKKISFKYYQWDVSKKLVAKNGGSAYVVSPWTMIWDDENYYLIAFDSVAGFIKFYRVDKMKDILVMDEKREGREEFEALDLAGFAKRTFGMFGGKTTYVTLECENDLIGVMIDRFGTDAMIAEVDENHFRITIDVSISGQFYGWLVGLGPGVKIKDPEWVRDEFKERLRSMFL